MACDVSWKLKLSTINDENQHEELDGLIEYVNEKTYAYADVRAQNQDLLITISELKNKLNTVDKGKNVNTKSKPVTSYSTPKNEQSQKQGFEIHVSNSIGVKSSNSVRRPESNDIKSKNRVSKNTNANSSTAHVWKMSRSASIDSSKREIMHSNVCQSNTSVLNNKNVTTVNDGSNIVSVSCGKDLFLLSHEKCVGRYALSRNSSVKGALFTTPIAAKTKNLGATYVVAKSRLSIAKTPTTTNKVIQLVFWIIDSGCSKHMTGNLQLLRNFVEKFMGTICFGNDHFAITGYGDYVQGNLTICHLYYVEGFGHNLFLVGKFCDGDLEVAFRSNTCYVRNLEGDDLLTGSRDSILYTIFIYEMADSSPVCLLSRATSTKS
ncbi:hypothetical protein Tco_0916886 [Tanacetum coccineum]